MTIYTYYTYETTYLGGKDGAPETDGKSVGCCVAVGKFVGLYDGE